MLDTAIARLPDAGLTLLLGLVVVEILLLLFSKVLKLAGMKTGLRKVLKSLARSFLFLVLGIAVIQALGLNNIFVALTGSTVVLALLISTGAAPLITDVIAGLMLGSDREFQPGATVRAGDKGTEGVIQTMDVRKVYLKDTTGKLHVLPNSLVEKNEWVILRSVNPGPRLKRRRAAIKRSTTSPR